MSEAQKTEEISQEPDFDIEALQANIDNTLIDEPEEEVVVDEDLVVEPVDKEIIEEPFDIDAAINSGEHVNLSDKVTQEQAEEAAKGRGWNEEGTDKYGHKISAIEFLERSSFFRKNDLLKGDIDEVNKKVTKLLEQNQQIAQKSINDKKKMLDDFEAEKTRILSEDFLDSDGINRLKEVDAGIAENTTESQPTANNEQIIEDYETAKVEFVKDNDWYQKDYKMTQLADDVGTKYAKDYYEEHNVLPAPEATFKAALDAVNEKYPAKEKEVVKKATRVASGNRVVTQTNKPKKKTLADLPEDQRALAAEVMEATGQTEADYLSTYNF